MKVKGIKGPDVEVYSVTPSTLRASEGVKHFVADDVWECDRHGVGAECEHIKAAREFGEES